MSALPRWLPSLEEVGIGVSLIAGLPGLLRAPIDLERGAELVRARLDGREEAFLDRARHLCKTDGPYRRLFDHAGCEYGDIERLARAEGVEGALRALQRSGAYLTVDEYRGRRPVLRGSQSFTVRWDQLVNRDSWLRVAVGTSGSSSSGRAELIPMSAEFIKERALNSGMVMGARGGVNWSHAVWGVPGGASALRLLEFCAYGARPVRWFSQIAVDDSRLHVRYRLSARLMEVASRLLLRPLPCLEHVSIARPEPIVRWMRQLIDDGGAPHLHTFASSAVRVALEAARLGVDLTGAAFTMSSEPITPARLATVLQSGAIALPCYAAIDAGPIGYGCFDPSQADDMHLMKDLVAVIQPTADGAASLRGDLSPDSLLVTSLRPSAPMALFNTSLGDQAVLSDRRCGCALERLGWDDHLSTIRSREKLTAGGMTFLDVDVVRILEETLPRECGGGTTDYQLVEEEWEDGQPRLSLVVSPDLGAVDERRVLDRFLAGLRDSEAARVMELQWRQAGWLRVVREYPRTTSTGKILHIHRAVGAQKVSV